MKKIRINSKLYYELFKTGTELRSLSGDKLIAVYALLKSNSDQFSCYKPYITSNNKKVSGYALLRAKTQLSLNTIMKYTPVLINMGLCRFDGNGGFVMLGNQKTKQLFNSFKLVPIIIGKNLTETALHSLSVRIDSSEKNQERQIRKKRDLSVQLFKGKDPKNLVAYKKAMKIKKFYGSEINITDKPVLSNKGFALIKDNTKDNLSKGSYWKRRLLSVGLISTHNRFKIVKKASEAEYREYKKYTDYNPTFKYWNGSIVEQLVSAVSSKRDVVILPLNS